METRLIRWSAGVSGRSWRGRRNPSSRRVSASTASGRPSRFRRSTTARRGFADGRRRRRDSRATRQLRVPRPVRPEPPARRYRAVAGGGGSRSAAGQPQPSLTLEQLGERGRAGGLLRSTSVRLTKRPLPRRFVRRPAVFPRSGAAPYVVSPWIQTHVPSVIRVRTVTLATGVYVVPEVITAEKRLVHRFEPASSASRPSGPLRCRRLTGRRRPLGRQGR